MTDFWSQGSVATFAGNGEGNRNGLNRPSQIGIDPSGQLIVTDSGNHCVRCVSLQGGISTVAGAEGGYRDGLASAAAFNYPEGLSVAEDGAMLVGDSGNHRLRKITRGEVSTVAGSGSRDFKDGSPSEAGLAPFGLALDGAGSIIVADHFNHRIRRVTQEGSVTTLAGTGGEGNKDGATQEASFFYPRAVAVGPSGGDFMVTDSSGRLCLIAHGRVSTVATGLNEPNGLLVDCRGNALVADSGNHRIAFCTPQGALAVIAGNGKNGFKDGPSGEASFDYPRGLALDRQGRVMVADSLNHRVRALSLPSTKTLQQELCTIQSSPALPVGCSVTRSVKSLFKWSALLQVAEGPFRGGLFELSLEMAFDYPASGPLVKFVPPIVCGHPNVDSVSGEVSYGEWVHGSCIVEILQQVQWLLEYPGQDLRPEQVRNKEALELWKQNRMQFDEGAHEAARQSWLSKLKPQNSEVNEMVCDLLCPAKKISQEVQHELFEAVAVPEIEEHVKKIYGGQSDGEQSDGGQSDGGQSEDPPVKLYVPGNLKQKQDMRAQSLENTSKAEQASLKAKLTRTLHSLLNLHNPRAAVLEWLERELARLCVEEAKHHTQNQEGGGENAHNASEKEDSEDEDRAHKAQDRAVQELLFQREKKARPQTSEQCFGLLVAEAEKEAKRLGGKILDCMGKYELLYSRMDKVQQIEDMPAKDNGPEVAASNKTKQPLDGSNQVLIAQAKRLEGKLRRKYRELVDTFNAGLDNKDNSEQRRHRNDKQEEKKMTVKEEGQTSPLTEAIKSSTLCLSSGLRAQAKFGPGKSLSRLQQKGHPRTTLDYTRTTVVFADPLLLALFFDLLRATFKVVRVTNKFLLFVTTEEEKKGNHGGKGKEKELRVLPQPPNVHVNFVFEGHVCEVQLFLEDFLWIKEFSHKPYEIVRLVRDGNKKKTDPKELREAVEHILAEGVYDKHPGASVYPLLSNSKLLSFLSQGDEQR